MKTCLERTAVHVVSCAHTARARIFLLCWTGGKRCCCFGKDSSHLSRWRISQKSRCSRLPSRKMDNLPEWSIEVGWPLYKLPSRSCAKESQISALTVSISIFLFSMRIRFSCLSTTCWLGYVVVVVASARVRSLVSNQSADYCRNKTALGTMNPRMSKISAPDLNTCKLPYISIYCR